MDGHGRDTTPSPPQQAVACKNGGYAFTTEDEIYCVKLARYALRKNPNLSISGLGKLLHEKVCYAEAGSSFL